jgi:hypothetical protein
MPFWGPVELWKVFHIIVTWCPGGTMATCNRGFTGSMAAGAIVAVAVGIAVGAGVGAIVAAGAGVAAGACVAGACVAAGVASSSPPHAMISSVKTTSAEIARYTLLISFLILTFPLF